MVAPTKEITRLLNIGDVARIMGVSREAVHQWVKKGAIPAIRLNQRTIRFKPREIETWLDAHRVRQATPASA